MSSLLDLPDELLLMIQDYLIARPDRLAFGSVNKRLHRVFGGKVLYEQDVAEERDFDEARLRLERTPRMHDLVLFDRQDLEKGININLAKTELALQNDHSWTRFVHRLRGDDTDISWASDPQDGLIHHPDLWTWLRVQSWRRGERPSGFPEDVCVWLVEHSLGFSVDRLSLGPRDLGQAAMNNHVRLVAAMLKLFQSRLGPDEYRDALDSTYEAALASPHGRFGQWNPQRSPPIENHIDLFNMLLRLGATLRRNPRRSWDWGILTAAVDEFPSDAIWLLRRQMAEGLVDHRDLRGALGRAVECRNDKFRHRKGTKEHLEFLAAVYPANAHLACDPRQVATPQGREEALEELLGQLLREVHHECDRPICKDVARYLEGVVGRKRIDEILGASAMTLTFGG